MKANKVDLEDTIDVDGLAETLEKLGDICFEKSEHLVSNWQDAGAAAQWPGQHLPQSDRCILCCPCDTSSECP